MAEVICKCRLTYQHGTSNKEYTVTIEYGSGLWQCVCWYGRIGSTQNRFDRTSPTSRQTAELAYATAISEKRAKGYSVDNVSQHGDSFSTPLVAKPKAPIGAAPITTWATIADAAAGPKLIGRGLQLAVHFGYANAARILTEMDMHIAVGTLRSWLPQIGINDQDLVDQIVKRCQPKAKKSAPAPKSEPVDFSQPKPKRSYHFD